jgi:predicted nucleotidyltransferase
MTPLLERLRQPLANGPRAHFVALFGSAATGKLRPDSDVDLAWLPADPNLPLSAELSFQAALSAAAGRDVDLVRMDQASTLCRHEVARSGILLSGDRTAFVRFQVAAVDEFLDFEPALRDAVARYQRALLGGVQRPQP